MSGMSDSCRTFRLCTGLAILGVFLLQLAAARPAAAQGSATGTNAGAIHFTGGVDFPSVYVFRGIVQEVDPALTMFPYGDLGVAFAAGDGVFKSVGANVGTRHSLQTGSSGSGGPSEKIHYEEDFYATLVLGFGGGLSVGTTYTAYTSPNFMFNNVKEISVKVSKSHKWAPYGIVAFELGGDQAGQADGGDKAGTYLELGMGPHWPLGGLTLTVPVKLGLSLKDYYQLSGEDHAFGYFDVGAQLAWPINKVPGRFGSWNVHGGVDFYTFGDATKEFNDGDAAKVVGLVGFGVSY
jgi:hypothetical protein